MGFCSSKEVISPIVTKKMSKENLSDLIYLKLQPQSMHINDDDYGLCSILDHQYFLSSDEVLALDKLKGPMCLGSIDNFALILLGRQKEWFARTCSYMGSAFGYLIEEDDRLWNFFVDNIGQLWLVNPRDRSTSWPPRDFKVKILVI